MWQGFAKYKDLQEVYCSFQYQSPKDHYLLTIISHFPHIAIDGVELLVQHVCDSIFKLTG